MLPGSTRPENAAVMEDVFAAQDDRILRQRIEANDAVLFQQMVQQS